MTVSQWYETIDSGIFTQRSFLDVKIKIQGSCIFENFENYGIRDNIKSSMNTDWRQIKVCRVFDGCIEKENGNFLTNEFGRRSEFF